MSARSRESNSGAPYAATVLKEPLVDSASTATELTPGRQCAPGPAATPLQASPTELRLSSAADRAMLNGASDTRGAPRQSRVPGGGDDGGRKRRAQVPAVQITWWAILLCALALMVAPCLGISTTPTLNSIRVVIRKMAESRSRLDPSYLNHLYPHFRDHLPFGFWPFVVARLSLGEHGPRFLAAAISLMVVIGVGLVGRRLMGDWPALAAMLVLASTETFFRYGAQTRLDGLVVAARQCSRRTGDTRLSTSCSLVRGCSFRGARRAGERPLWTRPSGCGGVGKGNRRPLCVCFDARCAHRSHGVRFPRLPSSCSTAPCSTLAGGARTCMINCSPPRLACEPDSSLHLVVPFRKRRGTLLAGDGASGGGSLSFSAGVRRVRTPGSSWSSAF